MVDSTKDNSVIKDNSAEQLHMILNSQISASSDDEYLNEIKREILEARIRLAKYALNKWEEEQRKKIDENLDNYIKS